jgi:hypothetical protein
MGTEPHFNLGNYFFRALLHQGSDVEMWNYSGNVDIFVRFGPQVDPYFLILMPNPSFGWRRAWFLLRNNADVPLPMFTGSNPAPHPNWGYSVAQIDLRRLQPLLEVIWGL